MKLNVGCGEFYQNGWLNIDTAKNEQVKPDRVMNVVDLIPGLDGPFEMIYCGHVLEHFEYYAALDALGLMNQLLKPDGRICVVGPDIPRARQLHKRGLIDAKTLEGAVHGDHRWDGDEHRWDCSEQRVSSLLISAGFIDVKPIPIASSFLDEWPVVSRASWQCAVLARAHR